MNDVVQALSLGLLHFVWQGMLIAAGLAVALRLIRESNAGLRYAVSVGAMGLMLAAPLATVALELVGTGSVTAVEATRITSTTSAPIVTDRPIVEAAPVATTALSADSLRRWAVAAWLLGVVAFALLNTGGWLQVQRLRRSGVPIDRPGWEASIAALCERLGVRRAVRVLESVRVDVPTVVGWLRPVILVPSAALVGMSPQALEALLLHELAHVRRHDYLVNLLQATVESLLFYHPAVWWVSRRVRAEREHCCDDLAVASCGSRRAYLHALAEMEALRSTTPRLAVAADGGSLMDRVRRLTGSSRPHRRPTRWSIGIATLAVALVVGLAQVAWLSPADAQSERAVLSNVSGEAIEGTWKARIGRDGEVWMQMHQEHRGRWETSFTRPLAEFTGAGDDGIPGFMLVRDAGTFFFEGALDGSEERRRFEFRADPSYVDTMRGLGFDPRSSLSKHYGYAVLDVSIDFARGIRDAGYGEIGMERLVEFRVHGVTPEFVSEMADTGYEDLPASRLVEFKIHGVSPEFVRGMARSGFDDLSPSRLVEFKIHGISPEYVAAMAGAGFEGLTASKLVEFKIHGVSPEFVRAMAESGFEDLTPQKLVEFKIHGVSSEFVRAMAASGFRDLSPQRLVEFRIHGVSPEFVATMADAGYADLPARKLVEFRIHGVSSEFVRELAALGLDDVPAQKLIEMRIHGVSPDFVESARSRYGDDLTVQDLIELRIHGGSRLSGRMR